MDYSTLQQLFNQRLDNDTRFEQEISIAAFGVKEELVARLGIESNSGWVDSTTSKYVPTLRMVVRTEKGTFSSVSSPAELVKSIEGESMRLIAGVRISFQQIEGGAVTAAFSVAMKAGNPYFQVCDVSTGAVHEKIYDKHGDIAEALLKQIETALLYDPRSGPMKSPAIGFVRPK